MIFFLFFIFMLFFLSLLLQCKFANSTLLSLLRITDFSTPYDAQASSAFSALILILLLKLACYLTSNSTFMLLRVKCHTYFRENQSLLFRLVSGSQNLFFKSIKDHNPFSNRCINSFFKLRLYFVHGPAQYKFKTNPFF